MDETIHDGEMGLQGGDVGADEQKGKRASGVFVSDVMSSSKAKTSNFLSKNAKTIPRWSWMRPLSLWRVGSLGLGFMDTG